MDPVLGIVLSLMMQHDNKGITGATFDVSPTFSVPTQLMEVLDRPAMALPGAVLYDPRQSPGAPTVVTTESTGPGRYTQDAWDDVLKEELMHVEQQRALGPLFWPAYGISAGEAFEPYSPLRDNGQPLDYGRMWMPTTEEKNRYPMFRMSWSNDGSRSYQFMPGYPELLRFEVPQ